MKNSDLLRYKGYSARPEYSAEDRIFYGKILGISDLVDFQSENAKDLEEEFHKAVDDYLEFCKQRSASSPRRSIAGCSMSASLPNCTARCLCLLRPRA